MTPSNIPVRLPDIVVAGDVCIDWLSIPVPGAGQIDPGSSEHPANWRLRDGVRMFAQPGGAWLLAAMCERLAGRPVGQHQIPAALENQGCDAALHSIVELRPKARTGFGGPREGGAPVWRVDRFRGFIGPPGHTPPPPPLEDDHDGVGLVVLDDAGNGFRDAASGWPAALARREEGPTVLWKLARPLAGGALAGHLLTAHGPRTIAIVDVDDLRGEGAAISRRLSWERTVGDVARALLRDRTFAALRKAAHVIVRLDLDGAILFSELGSESPRIVLSYFPAGIEGATRARTSGDMLGLGSAFTATMAAALVGADTPLADRIRLGVERGIAVCAALLRDGLGEASSDPQPAATAVRPDAKATDGLTTIDVAPFAGRQGASRLLDYVRREPLMSLAERIVDRGVATAAPQAPVAWFGLLETIDRTEIETYRSIRNLIGEYLALPQPERPLSIAVFGPPGSGKSFGVAQVAKSLGNVEKIDFNVSQFDAPAQLISALHVVRDAAVRGAVPLVFFDEFDTADLAWLKRFLAPMQDGKFSDGGSLHSIGRAIFVFAGGTKHTLGDFARLRDAGFIAAKGPDFVSRLRGFVDVLGTDRREPTDTHHVIRRAVLLRSMLSRKAPAVLDLGGTLRIDPGVRRAFLSCGSFVHGARSMESLIDMSLLTGRTTFERASLPSEQQLGLHVDAVEFMGLVTQDVQFNEHRERLAEAIHAKFVASQQGKKSPGDPAMQPWAGLAETYKDDNRRQADDIPVKLAAVGYALRAAAGRPAEFAFSPSEVDVLAEMEHERWNDAKRLKGYRYAPGAKDDVALTHPCLLPWADLPEHEKDKDRETVGAIPEFLASIGFGAVRME